MVFFSKKKKSFDLMNWLLEIPDAILALIKVMNFENVRNVLKILFVDITIVCPKDSGKRDKPYVLKIKK